MLIRFCRALAAGFVLAGLIAGCTVYSEQQLVSEAEATKPLPASFLLYSYKGDEANPGTYLPGDPKPQPMSLEGTDYVSADGSTRARFTSSPLGHHLVAFSDDDATLYGVAEIEGGVMALRIVIENDEDIDEVMEHERNSADASKIPALEAMVKDNEGLKVSTRQALELTAQWIELGTLKTTPLPMFVAPDANTPAPRRIIDDNGTWRTEN